MVAVLLTYGSALVLEHFAHLHVGIVIQSVVLTLTLARGQRNADTVDRAIGFAVLPAAAVAATGLSTLMSRHPDLGDALFVAAVCLTVWVRRFGPRAAKAGTTAVLPLIAVLVLRVPGGAPPYDYCWVALIALIAAFWVLVAQLTLWPEPAALAPVPATATAAGTVSTRMALQMGAALGTAFVVGRIAFSAHWPWAVLTAFIVCNGARGRADALHKGVLRAIGAALGTLVAAGIAGTGAFGAGDKASVVLILAVLGVATWLRPLSYAYWAGGVTAALSLLYGYFGESAQPLLRIRLEAILVGALIGIAASWLVLPVRTRDVLRRRTADALLPLGELLASLGAGPPRPAELRLHQARFDHGIGQLDGIAAPLEAHRALVRLLRPGGRRRPHRADAIDAVRRCVGPVHAIVGTAPDPEAIRLSAAVSANIGAVRRAIGRKPGPAYHRLPPREGDAPAGVAALTEIDSAMSALAALYPSRRRQDCGAGCQECDKTERAGPRTA
jgi:hypothetical protein